MNTDDLRHLLHGNGRCYKLDDFDNRGYPDLMCFIGGHAVFIFTEWTVQQQEFAKYISHQLAPHFLWKWLDDRGVLKQYDSPEDEMYIYTLTGNEDVRTWVAFIDEENQDFDYLEKYSMEG